MWISTLVVIALIGLPPQAVLGPQLDIQRAVGTARQVVAADLDPRLPPVRLENWLADVLPRGWRTAWRVGECNEKWDYPEPVDGYGVCVDAYSYSTERGLEIAQLLVLVGTTRKGLQVKPSFYQLLVSRDFKEGGLLDKLSDLPGWLKRVPLPAQAFDAHEALLRVKRTPARELDDRLPPVRVDGWLRATIPKVWTVAWRIGDCDERCVPPEPPGRERVCVKVSATAPVTDRRSVRLLFLVGRTRAGLFPRPSVYQVLVEKDGREMKVLDRLSDLSNWLMPGR